MDLAPDEYMRLDVPIYIVNHGSLPLGSDPEIVNDIWGTSYGFSAYGSSLVAVPFMALAKLLFGTEGAMLHAARLTSVLFATATLFLLFRIGEKLKLPFSVQLLSVVLLGFLPQYAFLASYFNSEQMSFFSTALTIFFLIDGVTKKWRVECCVGLGISLGLVSLSYYYAYGAILASIVIYFGTALGASTKNDSKIGMLLFRPMLILGVSLLVGGWFFLRNAILYNGDLFGMSTSSALSEQLAADAYKPSNRVTPKTIGLSPIDVVFGSYAGIPWLESSLQSFVGVFGYMNVPIGDGIYLFYWFILFGGLIVGIFRVLVSPAIKQKGVTVLGGSIILFTPFLLSVYYSWSSDYQAQGRYLMEGICALVILSAYGWDGAISGVATSLACRLSPPASRRSKAAIKEEGRALPEPLAVQKAGSISVQRAIDGVLFVLCLVYVLMFIRVVVNVIVPQCMGALNVLVISM